MDNELIERARELAGNDYSDQGNGELRELVPALCDALEAAQAENAQLRAERDAAIVRVAEWVDTIYAIGKAAKCFPSSFPDGNQHIINAIAKLRGEVARLTAERDAADYLLAEGDAHSPADFDGEVQRLKAENARLREALANCRQAAWGKWRDEWQEKYFSRVEAVASIVDDALEPRP